MRSSHGKLFTSSSLLIGADMDNEFYIQDIQTFTLEYEDGSSQEYEFIAVFDYEEGLYIAAAPLEGDGDLEEPVIYLYACTEDEDGYLDISEIEDDDLYEAVIKRFEEIAASDNLDD